MDDMDKDWKIFISSSHEDADFASKLKSEFEKQGSSVTLPSFDFIGGDKIFETIHNDIKAANMLVFVVPKHESESKWALLEVGAAKALHKKIVALIKDPQTSSANTDLAVRIADLVIADAGEK